MRKAHSFRGGMKAFFLIYVNVSFMNKKWYNETMKIKGFDASLILSLMDTMVSLVVKVLMK